MTTSTDADNTGTDKCNSSEGALCAPGQNFINVPADTALGCGDCHRNYILFPD